MNNKRKAYEKKVDDQLDKWNVQIGLLKAKADKAEAQVKIDYYNTIEALQHKRDEGRTKLHELKVSGDDAWGDLKEGAEKVWSEIKMAFKKAESNFK
jgi:predicted ATP-binding protein involved in virulence